MVVVYPLTNQKDYTELRFSLRSIEKYLQHPFEVVIVGDHLPEWINNVTVIEVPDIPGKKQLSIRRKILAALECYNEILCMSDDIYLTKEIQEFAYYWFGSLKGYAESGAKPLYNQLKEMGKPVKNFDIHYPIIYKQEFKQLSQQFDDSVIIKSMYANYLNIDGAVHPDFKFAKAEKTEVMRQIIKGNDYFSTGTYSLPNALPILNELFPLNSKYEI